jgi:hypothetical protein
MYFSAAPYKRSVAVLAAAVLVLCLLQRGGGYAAERGEPPSGEYQVKAAFVYNFIKFVEWPSGERLTGDTFRVCILGEVPAAAPFEDLNGQEVLGRRLSVTMLKSPQEARACQVLFVAAPPSVRLTEVLDSLSGVPVLTIGDTDGYAKRGIMINMFLENKRVRFEINAETARAAGLRISTKLLKLASKVYGAAPGGE